MLIKYNRVIYSNSFEIYENNVKDARQLTSLYEMIVSNSNIKNYDATKNILRGEYVLLVSAFDKFFHDLFIEFNNDKMHDKIEDIGTEYFCSGEFNINEIIEFGKIVKAQKETIISNKKKTFQKSDKIEKICKKMGFDIWTELSKIKLKNNIELSKDLLDKVIDRRDKIVHEYDNNPKCDGINDITIDDVIIADRCLYLVARKTYDLYTKMHS